MTRGGGWKETIPLFELDSDGNASAIRGPHKLTVNANLNSYGAIKLTTPQGRTYQTHILGLYYFDPDSGRVAAIAAPANSVGEIQPPNQVVWKSAFASLDVDVRITYDRAAIELDLIFNELPPPPSVFGLGTESRIEVWHEFVAEPPAPQSKSRLVQQGSASSSLLYDEILDFGDLWIPGGIAFNWGGQSEVAVGEAARVSLSVGAGQTPNLEIAKSWRSISGRTVLVESLMWSDVAALAAGLPVSQAAVKADITVGRVLPEVPPALRTEQTMETSATRYIPNGLVWDYKAVIGSGSETFYDPASAPGTYLVSGATYYSGTLTFMPGCIIKFEPSAYLLTYGTIQCSSSGAKSILTTKNDPRFGETPLQSCPGVNANPALWAYYIDSPLTIRNMRICFAQTALRLESNGSPSHQVVDCQLESCTTGVYLNRPTLYINTSTAIDVSQDVNCVAGNWGGGYGYFLDKQSLLKHVSLASLRLPSGHTTPADLKMYTDTGSPEYYPLGHNQSCWISGFVGKTSLSMSNSAVAWWQGAGTLISPRFAVTADHMGRTIGNGPDGGFVGRQFRWIGTDGQHYVRTCIAQTYVDFGVQTDMCVIRLDSSLPAEVRWVKVVPSVANVKVPWLSIAGLPNICTMNLLPCITTHGNLPKTSYAYDWHYESISIVPWAIFAKDQWLSAGWGRGEPAGGQPYPGDSGQPSWVIVNNELVLVGTWSYVGAAPWYGYDIGKVNDAIAFLSECTPPLQPPYDQATPISLANFPDMN